VSLDPWSSLGKGRPCRRWADDGKGVLGSFTPAGMVPRPFKCGTIAPWPRSRLGSPVGVSPRQRRPPSVPGLPQPWGQLWGQPPGNQRFPRDSLAPQPDCKSAIVGSTPTGASLALTPAIPGFPRVSRGFLRFWGLLLRRADNPQSCPRRSFGRPHEGPPPPWNMIHSSRPAAAPSKPASVRGTVHELA